MLVSPLTPDEILAKRKQKLEQLLESCIKHNYHMKLDLEQEKEKEVKVKDEITGKIEKHKQWVWEPIPLETVLKDGKNYILVNPSGMGKTTFLTYAACALLDQAAHYPFLPLFFTCIGINNLRPQYQLGDRQKASLWFLIWANIDDFFYQIPLDNDIIFIYHWFMVAKEFSFIANRRTGSKQLQAKRFARIWKIGQQRVIKIENRCFAFYAAQSKLLLGIPT